jgi:lipoprotein-anchoring transpeptidase ErfK/SrfK
VLAIVAAAGATQPESSPAASNSAPGNQEVLRAQIFLDASPFKPGVIDGRWGEFTGKALTRYEQAQGRDGQGYGGGPPAQFDLPLDDNKPVLTTYRLTPGDKKWIGSLPKSHAEQAKLDRLPYEDFLELVAEKFHARHEFLRQINPGYNWNQAKPGDEVKVPNVAKPFDVQEAVDLKEKTKQAEKAGTLQTEDEKAKEEQFSIMIDVKEKILELHQAGKLAGSYPITPGSESLPAPRGDWFVKGFSWMPIFRWDEAMLQHGEKSSHYYQLPPGPNNPVGILWMDLNHKGTGIHGTETPETIGRSTSHGCIRLSNWDALDLGRKVRPGVHVHIR